jgi:xanthine dehydrogenase accessory factor
MKDLLDTLHGWRADGVDAGRAVVVRTFGSSPRPAGAVLLYASDGRVAGSVSGGCVEGAAAEEIELARQTGRARVVRYGISDEQAWGVGLACGGTIDVLVEPRVPGDVVAAAAAEEGRVVITPLPRLDRGEAPAARLVVDDRGELSGTTGVATTDRALVAAARDALLRGTSCAVEVGGREYFLEAFPVRPRLVIVGAVEIARALVRLAHELDFETVVVDGRPSFATAERFPDADQLVVGWPDEVANAIGLGPDDCVAVLTHDVKFDEPAITVALRRRCRYVGAIGSKKTQADRRERLRANGVSDADLARLHGPIGLDLGGRSPAETALAILAEIVAARYGASGAPLREGAASGR